jgi:hypothetical protein
MEIIKFKLIELQSFAFCVFHNRDYFRLLKSLDTFPLKIKDGIKKTFYQKIVTYLMFRYRKFGDLTVPPAESADSTQLMNNFNGMKISFEFVHGFSISSELITLIFHNNQYCTLTVKDYQCSHDEYVFTFKIIEFMYFLRLLYYLTFKQHIESCPKVIFAAHMIRMFRNFYDILLARYVIQEIKTSITFVPVMDARRSILAHGLGIHYITSSMMRMYSEEFYDGNSVLRRYFNKDIYAKRTHIQILRVTTAYNFFPRCRTRFQAHCLLSFPSPSVTDCLNINEQLRKNSNLFKDEEFKLWKNFTALPPELQLRILTISEPFKGLKSACENLVCERPRHGLRCRRSMSLFRSEVDLLFPVRRRILQDNDGRSYVSWYCIISTQNLMDVSHVHTLNEDQSFSVERMFEDCCILDACHSQPVLGFLPNHDEPVPYFDVTLKNLKLLKPISLRDQEDLKLEMTLNDFGSKPFSCSHRNEFVPKISSQKDHLLMFN